MADLGAISLAYPKGYFNRKCVLRYNTDIGNVMGKGIAMLRLIRETLADVRLLACFSSLAFVLIADGAVTTNRWIGASGGSWGVAGNWSLGHIPGSGELAYFDFSGQTMEIAIDGDHEIGSFYVEWAQKPAPLVLKGSGSVTLLANAGKSPYIMQNHPTTLDGVTLNMTTLESLWYSPVTICNGAVLTNTTGIVRLWGSDASLTVENATVALGGLLGYAASANALVLNGGSVCCSTFTHRDGYEDKAGVALAINGGTMTVKGDFAMTGLSSLKMQDDGSLTVGGNVQIAEGTALDLTGGAITNASTLTVSGKRLVTESKGTAFAATASGTAVDFIEEAGEVVTFNAPFSAPNGQFLVEKRCTLVSHEPFTAMQFLHGANSSVDTRLTLKLDTLTIGGYAVFNTVNGDARKFDVDGPVAMRPTAEEMSIRVSKTVYPLVEGTLTIDTRDANDDSVKRNMAFPTIGSRNGNGSLLVCGGGSLWMRQCFSHMPFREVRVEDGTTLEIGPYEHSDYAGLRAEKIVLGPESVLKIPAGTNMVSAAEWVVDPTAKIVLDVQEGTSDGGVLAATGAAGQLPIDASQVELTGSCAGWKAVSTNGVIAAVKPASAPDGLYPYEWIGEAGDGYWSSAANWYCRTAPDGTQGLSYYFGAAAGRLESDFNIRGAKLANITFRDTAVASFVIGESDNERTFTKTSEAGDTDSSVYSLSAFPQYVGLKARNISKGLSFTSKAGPLVITSPMFYYDKCPAGILNICGDIRISGTPSYPQVCLRRGAASVSAQSTQLTILPGGSLTLTNQTMELGWANSSIRVCRSGTLTFQRGSDGAFYWWKNEPGRNVVDGTLEIGVPYRGGKDQIYGGTGVMSLAEMRPESTSSLTLADAITAEMTTNWTTASDAENCLSLKAAPFSSPVVRVSSDWTYGPAEGLVTTGPRDDRALAVGREAVLTIDAGGHVVTLADSVAGEGTLAITNGTLRLPSGSAVSMLRLDADSVLEVSGDLSVNGLASDGGTVRFAPSSSVTCAASVNLDSMRLAVDGGLTRRWRTLFTAPQISGTPILPVSSEVRVEETADGFAFQMRAVFGAVVVIR